MSGNLQSPKTIDEKISEYVKEFEQSLGLLDDNNESVRLMKATQEDIKKMSAYDASEAAIVLSQFAIFIHSKTSELAAKIKACQNKINQIIVSRLSQQKAYNYEERRLCAIREDTVATEFYQTQCLLEVKYERVNFLSSKIQHYSDKFTELSKTLNKRNI